MRPAVPALLLLLCLPARARERAMETSVAIPQVRLSPVPDLSFPLAPAGPGGLPSVGTALTATAALPQVGGAPTAAALALPAALPAALPSGLPGPKATIEAGAWNGAAQSLENETPDADSEAGFLSGGHRFDGAAEREGSPLSNLFYKPGRWKAITAYRDAMENAEKAGWADQGAAAVDAGLELWNEQGVKAERGTIQIGRRSFPAATVLPEKKISPLNDLAFDLQRQLGVTLALIPAHKPMSSGAYAARHRLILLSDLDGPQLYAVALHEARHAWYSALLRRGEIRLFHAHLLARPGQEVRPGARTYTDYVSLEEISTFPKTLKHLLTERAKADPGTAALLEKAMNLRVRQLADLLKTMENLSNILSHRADAGTLEPRLLTPEELETTALEVVPGLAWYEVPMSRTKFFIPVPVREKRFLGFKTLSSSKKEARAAALARAQALSDLVAAMAPAVLSYYEAVEKRDWAAASAAAGVMVSAVAAAENSWKSSSPHGVPGKPGS